MKRFTNKVALVTGGASGIGKATVERLAREGAAIMVADINVAGAEQVAASVAATSGARVTAWGFDGANPDSCDQLIRRSAEEHGRLDVLCNIAGITDWGPFAEFPDQAWERTLAINLNAAFYLTKRAIPHLIATRGNVVNMASAAALVGIPYTTAYCASKAALVAMTKSVAVEHARAGVRANAICPSGVRTPMHEANLASFPANMDMNLIERLSPLLNDGEVCEPEDIAAAVAFLASDEARYITGIALAIDGGQTAA